MPVESPPWATTREEPSQQTYYTSVAIGQPGLTLSPWHRAQWANEPCLTELRLVPTWEGLSEGTWPLIPSIYSSVAISNVSSTRLSWEVVHAYQVYGFGLCSKAK